jgi:hypothetical protein
MNGYGEGRFQIGPCARSAPPVTPMVVQAWAYGAYPRKRLRMVARAMRLPPGPP